MTRHLAFALSLLLLAAAPVHGQPAGPDPTRPDASPPDSSALTVDDQVRFLESAEIKGVKAAKKGIAGTQRATLSNEAITHDASIQTIDLTKALFQSAKRTELGFRDYWGFNVAAYRLGVMLGLDMIPPSVARKFQTREAAFTWWVDDVILDEGERVKQKRTPPDSRHWSEQMQVLRVFDELIANTDRNQGNLLIDKNWKLWFIDHTRAFRTTSTLQAPRTMVRCQRPLLEAMKTLTFPALQAQLDQFLTRSQIEAILKRRDLLVRHFDELGPQAVYQPESR